MGPHEYLDCKLALAARYKFSTTSGRRTEYRNNLKSIRGHKNSRHLLGFVADDCVLDPGEDKLSFIADAKRLGLRVVVKSDHVHLQTK